MRLDLGSGVAALHAKAQAAGGVAQSFGYFRRGERHQATSALKKII